MFMLSVLETIKGTAVINQVTIDQVTIDQVTIDQVTIDQVTIDQVTIDQVSLPALAATVTKLDLGLLNLLHGIKSFDNESD